MTLSSFATSAAREIARAAPATAFCELFGRLAMRMVIDGTGGTFHREVPRQFVSNAGTRPGHQRYDLSQP